MKRLALRELERTTGFRLAVLFTFDDTRVAGQEAALLQDAAQIRLEVGERLRDAVTYGACLARQTAAGNSRDNVVLTLTGSGDDRLLNQHAEHWTGEIYFDFTGVN